MRTTLTLEPDVRRLLEQESERTRKPFKQVVNEALRRGLTRAPRRSRKLEVLAHDTQLRPGIDPMSLNALVDDLEDSELLSKARK